MDVIAANELNAIIGYQGSPGAYSYLAAQYVFGTQPNFKFIGYDTFSSLLAEVKNGNIDYGLLPIENTIAGTVHEALNLLLSNDLFVVGEVIQKIEHCLIALAKRPVQEIRRIYSHPQALMQCSLFLNKLAACEALAYLDTAMAVEKICAEKDPFSAAIASRQAATIHNLAIIKDNIANVENNHTRMLVVSKNEIHPSIEADCKTSLVFDTKHEHGALLSALTVFHKYDLNLTKIESRPRPQTPFQYRFFVEFTGNTSHKNVMSAIEEVESKVSYFRILGCYKSASSLLT